MNDYNDLKFVWMATPLVVVFVVAVVVVVVVGVAVFYLPSYPVDMANSYKIGKELEKFNKMRSYIHLCLNASFTWLYQLVFH